MALIQECSQETKIAPDKSTRECSPLEESESEAWRGCAPRAYLLKTQLLTSKCQKSVNRSCVVASRHSMCVCLCSQRKKSLKVSIFACCSRVRSPRFWSALALSNKKATQNSVRRTFNRATENFPHSRRLRFACKVRKEDRVRTEEASFNSRACTHVTGSRLACGRSSTACRSAALCVTARAVDAAPPWLASILTNQIEMIGARIGIKTGFKLGPPYLKLMRNVRRSEGRWHVTFGRTCHNGSLLVSVTAAMLAWIMSLLDDVEFSLRTLRQNCAPLQQYCDVLYIGMESVRLDAV